MADYDAGSMTGNTNFDPSGGISDGSNPAKDQTGNSGGSTIINYFQMAWKDVDPGPSVVRIWVSTGNPDPTGVAYTGPKNGSTPITGASAIASWSK